MFVTDREVLRMDFIRSSEVSEAPFLPSEVRHQPLPRQVVTLAFLSAQIPAAHISEQLARLLSTETNESVVLVRLQPQDGIGSTNREARPEFFLNGEFHMPPE